MTRQELAELQREKLCALLRFVSKENRFYRAKLAAAAEVSAGCEGGASVAEILRRLPFTTKRELEEDQRLHPPYGSNLSYPLEAYTRLHQTSGTTGAPLRWLDTRESWQGFLRSWETIYGGLGLRPRDRLFFPFSFGPFIGFWAAFDAAGQLGALCLAGGGMSTPSRLRFLLDNEATIVVCTPTYALRMAEVAHEEGLDLAASSVRALLVAGEPGGSVPSTRARMETAWNARVFDHCGMTEVGAFGFESAEQPGGLYVVETEFIVEVLEPGGTTPAPEGQDGELVMTNLSRWGSPVIRYRTGDLVRWSTRAPSAQGFGRLEGGILARLDDLVIIRGNNLHPSALEAVLRGFEDVVEYRAVVRQAASLAALEIEVEPRKDVGAEAGKLLAQRVASALEKRFLFRARVNVVPPGSLPRFELKAKRFVKDTDSPRSR